MDIKVDTGKRSRRHKKRRELEDDIFDKLYAQLAKLLSTRNGRISLTVITITILYIIRLAILYNFYTPKFNIPLYKKMDHFVDINSCAQFIKQANTLGKWSIAPDIAV